MVETSDYVRNYKVVYNNNIPSLVDNNYYKIGAATIQGAYNTPNLYKFITKNENWRTADLNDNTTHIFKDYRGRIILSRTFENQVKHDTYYVYDDYGNLVYVLTPKADASIAKPDSTVLSELCFQYIYDDKNRLVEKKIPGKGWEYIVYNLLDLPVLSQDANLRTQNKWLFTKYDAFGRVAFTGIQSINFSRTQMQEYANNETTNVYTQFVEKTTSPQNIAGTTIYYTNTAIPYGVSEIYTINYYDNYTFDGFTTMPLNIDGQAVINYNNLSSTQKLTKGLPTGSKVRVFDSNPVKWITTVTGYDVKGRGVYIKSVNDYLVTTDIIKNTLDFTGAVNKTVTEHNKNGNDVDTEDLYTYDHMSRLKKQTQIIDGVANDEETIVENTYDELGQLENKGVGGKTTQGRLQTVNYAYNIRGWLKEINDVSSLGSDLFGFKINYNTIDDSGSTPLFNGNISETIWMTASEDYDIVESYVKNSYSYNYDALNRIKSADMTSNASDWNNRYDLNLVDYDKNGNIMHLERLGHRNTNITTFGLMDDLTYTYEGNQLKSVNDDPSASDDTGFIDGAESSVEYTYDANGNMLRDLNKGITTDIVYNHLNLPTDVSLGGGTISYIYDATGVKLQKVVSNGGATTDYAGNYIYEDTGSGSSLKFFNHSEGYVEPNGNSYDYVYQYKDHLGNVRLSYKDSNGNGSINEYTEIVEENNYYPFGLKHKGYNNGGTAFANIALKKKFAGEEFEDELGKNTVAFQWRDYDPAIGRFNKIDRFAEKYFNSSPYGFTKNNPIFFREIAGDSIHSDSQDDFDSRRNDVQNEQNRLSRRRDRLVKRGAKQSRINKFTDRIDGLGEVVGNLNDLESSNVMFKLNKLDSKTHSEGNISYDTSDNSVSINYVGSTSNFVHESTHAHQFHTGNIAFPAGGGNNALAVDIFDEVSAYKAQYAYNPSSVTGLTSNSRITSIRSIGPDWVRNIKNTTNNSFPYMRPHVARGPVNVDTTVRILRIAYPSVNYGNTNDSLTLKQIYPSLIHNK